MNIKILAALAIATSSLFTHAETSSMLKVTGLMPTVFLAF